MEQPSGFKSKRKSRPPDYWIIDNECMRDVRVIAGIGRPQFRAGTTPGRGRFAAALESSHMGSRLRTARVGAAYCAAAGGVAYCAATSTPATDMMLSPAAQRQHQRSTAPPATRLPSAYDMATVTDTSALRFHFAAERVSLARTATDRPLAFDSATEHWVAGQFAAPRTAAHSVAVSALKLAGVHQTDAQAILDSPAIHLLSRDQWCELLGGGSAVQRSSALDVGAGSGHITEALAPAFADGTVFATEISGWLKWRLERREFRSVVQRSDGPPTAELLQAAGLPSTYGTVLALNGEQHP